MPLNVILAAAYQYFPTKYFIHVALAISLIFVIRIYCQGRVTTRERDLHTRVVLITGGFSPLGLTLIEALAKRGARVIALSPVPTEAPQISLVIEALREVTSNTNIHAEFCDLTCPNAVRQFCVKFVSGQDKRIDALIFAHEYEHIGSFIGPNEHEDQRRRSTTSLSTFLMTTLLLPPLLVAPAERDIRIINVVNPFYAAAVPSFSPTTPTKRSIPLQEGHRALRTIILTRHLQRVLDSLPAAPAPDPATLASVPAATKSQKSNIVAISVSPGFSRADIIAPMMGARGSWSNTSAASSFLYFALQPILQLINKSSYYAMQSILHALFLPTSFKLALSDNSSNVEEVLKPGALYSNCTTVRLNLPIKRSTEATRDEKAGPVDDDFGGEELGRAVWESYEAKLKVWEEENPPPPSDDGADEDQKRKEKGKGKEKAS